MPPQEPEQAQKPYAATNAPTTHWDVQGAKEKAEIANKREQTCEENGALRTSMPPIEEETREWNPVAKVTRKRQRFDLFQ